MAERPVFEDRGSPAIFGCVPYFVAVTTSASAAGDAVPRPGPSTAVNTAIIPFNAYVWGGGIQLNTALTDSDSFTVKIRKGTTVIASTKLLAGARTLSWAFGSIENTLSSGAALNVLTTNGTANGAAYNMGVDVWVGPRSNTL